MPTMLDIINESEKPKEVTTGTNPVPAENITNNAISGNGPRSMLDIISEGESISQPTIPQPTTPTIPQPTINVDAYDPVKTMSGLIVPKAEEVPKAKVPVVTPEESSGAMEALNKVWGAVKNPYDVVKGTVEFVASLPGFGEGAVAASWEASKAIGKGANLSQTYDAASKGMQDMMADWDYKMVGPLRRLLDSPKVLGKLAAEKVTGVKNVTKEEDYSGVVGDVAMAPLNLVMKATHSLASSKAYDNYPNVRGAISFGGDIIGLLLMGRLYKGGPAELAKDIEPIIMKADAINKQQKVVDAIPNEILKKAEENVLKVQKVQLELEAKALQDKIDHKKVVEEDLKAKGQEVQDIKEGKKPVEVEEELLENTEFDDALLGDLGYEKDEIANMTAEDRKRVLSVDDEIVLPLNELDTIKPAKSGIDILQTKESTPDKAGGTNIGSWEDFSKMEISKQPKPEEIISTTPNPERGTTEVLSKRTLPDGELTVINILDKDGVLVGGQSKFVNRVTGEPTIRERFLPEDLRGKGYAQDLRTRPEFKDALPSPARTEAARKADAKIGIEPKKDVIKPPTDEAIWKKRAEKVGGVKFNEMQEFPNGKPSRPTFTLDRKDISPTTFMVNKGETLESAIARKYKEFGKSKDSINKFYEKYAKVPKEPITDLDLQTGTPLPKRLSTQAHPFRDKDVEHTNTMRTMLQERVNAVDASPEVFTRYLINEVNRYLNGEDVPIDKVRDGISELSARADNLRLKFDKGDDFIAWKNSVKAAASWARGADRLDVKRTGGGTKLSMGVDLPEATRKIIAGAKALATYTAKARGMKEFKPGAAATQVKEELVRSIVDRSGNIRKNLLDELGNDGYEIVQKMYLSKGASSLAAQNLKQMSKEVYDGLTKDDKRILDNLILADRMLDIGKYKTASQFKFPEGLSPVESASYNELFQFTEKITPEKAEILKQRAAAYFDWMKKPLKDMLDAGLIDQTEYDALASHNYRRLKLVDVFDKRYQTKVGKTKRTVYDSGVESLSRGRETDVFEPSSEVMALEVFNRAYGRILNNAANKTLLDLAQTNKDNPFVATKDKATDHIPSGWDRIFVYDKGKRKALYLSPEMSKEWITNSPEMSYKMSQVMRYASGSPVLRTFATGIEWSFALANLPRDIMHIWYAAREFKDGNWKPLYNSNMPVYGVQMGLDLTGVFNDAALRKGKYLDYIKEGGGMEFLVHQGRLMQRGRHIEGSVDKVQNVLGYPGETSEIMTRLAVRDRVIKKRANEQELSYEEASKDKKITQEATFAARDYMDFGQGGGVAKALDNGIPYLNASIQGTRGLFRAFKDNPAQSTYKLAQFAVLVTGLYIANQGLNPKTMEALKGNIDMQGNLVIPLGDTFGFDDEKGQRRYPYMKIPLDPSQKFFKTFFEASYDKSVGNKVDVDAVTNSLSQISPVSTSSLPPTVSGPLGYMYNKDFWLNEDIWKKTDKPLGWPQSKEEYIPGKTPQAFIDAGAITGLSPERLKYTMSELVTGGSMWAWIAGQGYDSMFKDVPQNKREFHLAETLARTPISKRFIGITNPYTQFASPIEQAKEESMMKRWVENRGLDQRVESYLYEGGKRSEVIDYIQATAKDQDTQDRLKDRFIFQEKIKALPNRAFWLSLKSIPDTEARAKVFVERYDSAPAAAREQMSSEIDIVNSAGGVISDEFKQQVMKIRDARNRGKITQ